MNTKAIFRGGPANGASVDIDPRAHRWIWLGGHWYYRDLSNKEMMTAAISASIRRGSEFDYRHSANCCEGDF
jgi:hypothetical protein